MVQTTIPLIQTSIPLISTTNPIIETTVSIIETTIPIIETTIPIIETTISIIETTIPIIQTTIPIIETTIPIIQTTIPIVQTTIIIIETTIPIIETTIPIIETTIPIIETNIPIIQTTIPIIETTIPIIEMDIAHQYIMINEKIYFNISLDENIISDDQVNYKLKLNNIYTTFTSTKYYQNNKNENRTIIDLRNCEYKLKDAYNISYNKTLFVVALEITQEGMKIPIIEYEVYYKTNENKLINLNLIYCKNEKIEISTPISINSSIDVYNPKSGYYNDLCYIVTTSSGTDICLEDRRQEFIDKNLSICEENCDFKYYNYTNKKVTCSCAIKLSLSSIQNIKIDKEKLKKNFKDINNIANIKFLICYKIAFKKKNLLSNIGFYIMDFIFLLYIIFLILFYSKYQHLFLNEIKKVFNNSKNGYINTNNKNNLNKTDIIENRKKIVNIKKKSNKNYKTKKSNVANARRYKTKISSDDSKTKNILFFNKKNKKEKNNNFRKKNYILEYNDTELNALPYKNALKNDKRTYMQYYLSLLKIKHQLIFSFCPSRDYNSRIIKIILFLFFFVTELTINALFFNDETMHKIYVDQGSFNLAYQIPQIIYSSLLSLIMISLFQSFSLTESNILVLKEEMRKKQKNFDEKLKKLFRKIKIKFIFFFIFTTTTIFVFWFYITCFCGIYKNTQIHLIKDTILSFVTSFIFQFIKLLVPGIFRRAALNNVKKDKKYLYNFSQFLGNI